MKRYISQEAIGQTTEMFTYAWKSSWQLKNYIMYRSNVFIGEV